MIIIKIYNHTNNKYMSYFCMFDWPEKNEDTSGQFLHLV